MTRSFDELPGITVWPAHDPGGPIVSIEGDAPPLPTDLAPRADASWARLCAANPRLFDGPILSLERFDPGRGLVACRRSSYKRLSVQDEVPMGVTLVAVNGVVTARDAGGREHVLLGRRSPGNRMYGGRWELAPAGGLEPPTADGPLARVLVLAQLRAELREECALDEPVDSARLAAFYRDDIARSFNIVFRVALAPPIHALRAHAPGRAWDCDDVLWLPLDDVPRFDREQGSQTIDATRALWRVLGWV